MSWYGAKILFESTIDGELQTSALCEESIRILLADDDESARERAEDIGRATEHEYKNEAGETVGWRFVTVIEVQELSEAELQSGTEVFSTLFRRHTET